ncbi:MAG: DUF2061 domain-containing protein [Candidatus Micrarchaeia archaeon]
MKQNARHHFKEHWLRSLVKTITYRLAILILDFAVVYLLTGRLEIAAWFMLASNTYTSIGYYLHERIWDKIAWGKKRDS